MKICLVNAVFDRKFESSEALFSAYWHMTCLAAALAERGHAVSIIQAFRDTSRSEVGGVMRYTVTSDRLIENTRHDCAELADYGRAIDRLDSIGPDVVHFFGLTLPTALRAIVRWAERDRTPVTASFHGGRPRRQPFARRRQMRACRGVAAMMFSAESYAERWASSRMVGADTAVHIVAEVSSPFAGRPRSEARHQLSIAGSPVLAWSGRLHPVKDPMTALQGFAALRGQWPDAQLVMAYQSDELMSPIRQFIDAHTSLRDGVRMLGALPHAQMEVLFSAADFFVQASLGEYGGNSLVEAMSCGAVPVVTDIPSFRTLTKDMPWARLFAPGDSEGMARAIDELMRCDLDQAAANTKTQFRETLSYAALACRYERAFRSAIERRYGETAT